MTNKSLYAIFILVTTLCMGCKTVYISVVSLRSFPYNPSHHNYGVSDFEFIINNDSIKREPKYMQINPEYSQDSVYWHPHVDYIYNKKAIKGIKSHVQHNILKKYNHKSEFSMPVFSKPISIRKAMQKQDIRILSGLISNQTYIMTERTSIGGNLNIQLSGYPASISRLMDINYRVIFHEKNTQNNDTLYMGNGNTHIFLWDKRSEMFRYKNFILFKNHYCQVKDGFDIYDILNPKEFADSGKCHIW